MTLFHSFSLILSIAALFAYINIRYMRLTSSISLMLLGVLLSFVMFIVGAFTPSFSVMVTDILNSIDFAHLLLEFMLSFLLFAGALHTDGEMMQKSKWSILSFATLGVLISAFIVGTLFYYLLLLFNVQASYTICLLFGTLISPTDPLAVLDILKSSRLPKSLEIKITGESLLNDGMGVVAFLSIYEIHKLGYENVGAVFIELLLIKEIAGGIIMGLVIGYVGFRLMESIDHYKTEVMISLAMVCGGYSLCEYLSFSGPLCMVVAGLSLGKNVHSNGISDLTRDYLNKFWEMLDEVLNALLFVLIGLEMYVINFTGFYLIIGAITIVIVLIGRYFSLVLSSSFIRSKDTFEPNALKIMTWGGLRGGVSIALALSLPEEFDRDLILSITYINVVFSILCQGLTIGRFIQYLDKREANKKTAQTKASESLLQ